MPAIPSRQPYANVAAGPLARGSRTLPAQRPLPPGHTYATNEASQPRMARQERRYSVRAELDAGEHEIRNDWMKPSNRTKHEENGINISTESSFFVPSYLTRSKHVERLRHHWQEQAARRRTSVEGGDMMLDSSNSSTSSLGRVHSSSPVSHMHRGVAQHVVERHPYQDDNDGKLRPLPSHMNEHDKSSSLELMGDGTDIRFTGAQLKTPDEAASIRSNVPVPKEVGLYYFEVTILSRSQESSVGVGLVGKKTTLTRMPGWEAESYAYHGDDGDIFSGNATGRSYGTHCCAQDVVGCGINFRTNSIFFTKNGVSLGPAFPDVKAVPLYPCIGLKYPGEHVRVNLGKQPFLFDIDSFMEQERQTILSSISRADTTKLHPPNDEPRLIQNLIAQYLAHEGYVATSRAFVQDLTEQRRLAPSTTGSSASLRHNAEDDVHAINRQAIRRAILDGDIDRALKHTKLNYPRVLDQPRNKDVYFRLRSRKFIEMMRQYSDLSRQAHPTSNGHSKYHDEFDTQMELDDQLLRETSTSIDPQTVDVAMTATSDLDTSARKEDLQRRAIEYGQGLEAEFNSNATPEVKATLEQIFALMAYEDPRESDLSHLLHESGRSSIAEDLNGAILVSLGKPSSAALEKLCIQTEALLDEVARKQGGAAAFVNLRHDLLKL